MGKRGRWIVVLVAVVAAVVLFLAGWSVRDAVLSGRGDWPATIGTAAAWTGDASKIALGALIGAVGAWIVAWQTRSDAREARKEARQDARDAAFLQERRAAIVAVLAEGERATGRIEGLAMKVDREDSPMPEQDMGDDFHRAWLELILMAPDLIAGPGAAYGVEVPKHMWAYTRWAFERLADVKAGDDVAPRPPQLDEVDARLDVARAAFLMAAIRHLGVHEYAHLDVDALLASLKSGGETLG